MKRRNVVSLKYLKFNDILKQIDTYKTSYVLHKADISLAQAQKIFNTDDVDQIKASVVLNVVLLFLLENK